MLPRLRLILTVAALSLPPAPAFAQFRAGNVVVGPGGTTTRYAPYGLYGPYITRTPYLPTGPDTRPVIIEYRQRIFLPSVTVPYYYPVPRPTTVILQRQPLPAVPLGVGAPTPPIVEHTVRKPAPEPAAARAAQLEVRVPADAQLWFEGTLTRQTGSVRRFVTPALTPGKRFVYELRARWSEGGATRERVESVYVEAGQNLQLDLMSR